MPPEAEPAKQRLQLEVEVAQESISKALLLLKELKAEADKVGEGAEAAGNKAIEMGRNMEKDLGGSLGKLKSALGPFMEFASAAGPLSAIATGVLLIDSSAADLNKTLIEVNKQFFGFKEASSDIANLKVELRNMGIDEAQGAAMITSLSRGGSFTNREDLNKAIKASAGVATAIGAPPADIANLVNDLVKSGSISAGSVETELPRKLKEMTLSAGEANMSISQYTKSVDELWHSTKNVNLSFGNAEKIVQDFSEEIRRGVFTIREIADAATGKGMGEGAKVFMAERFADRGLIQGGGSALEMETRFEKALAAPGGLRHLQEEIVKMTKDLSSSKDEQLQLVRKFSDQFGPSFNIDSIRKAETFLDGKLPAAKQSDQDRIENQFSAEKLGSMEKLTSLANAQRLESNSILSNLLTVSKNIYTQMGASNNGSMGGVNSKEFEDEIKLFEEMGKRGKVPKITDPRMFKLFDAAADASEQKSGLTSRNFFPQGQEEQIFQRLLKGSERKYLDKFKDQQNDIVVNLNVNGRNRQTIKQNMSRGANGTSSSFDISPPSDSLPIANY